LEIATLVIGIVTLAGMMRGITGFGGAMLMTPSLSILIGAAPAIVLVLVLEAAAALVMLPAIYKDLSLDRLGLLTVPACLSIPIGSTLLAFLDPSSSRRLIGAAVIVLSLALISGLRYSRRPIAPLTAAVGALSGVLLGATSIGAPPVILFLLSGPDSAASTRAILTAFISITAFVGIMASHIVGGVAMPSPWWAALLAMLYLASTWLGMKVFHRLSDSRARLIALSLMITFGALSLVVP
jgi:uncharacterized membrane protein YfcA